MVKYLVVLSLVVGCGKKADAPTPGSNDQGSARPAAADAAPAPVPDAAPPPATPDAAAAADNPGPADYLETLCPQVLPKIVECQKDPAFIAALDVGADAKTKKVNAKLLREVATWPDNMSCSDLAPAYQYGGFTYHWDKLAAVPDALTSCAKLGAAIQGAGGLFGGEQGN